MEWYNRYMGLSNYERMRNDMRLEFTKYDLSPMIEKYHLKSDDTFVYLDFLRQKYRIHRGSGVVEWSDDGFESCVEADYNESMTLYDLLCYAKPDAYLTGRFVPVNGLPGVVQSSGLGSSMFQKSADAWNGRVKELRDVCLCFGTELRMSGDISFQLQVTSFLPVILQYWQADDEFPANLKFMFDYNIQSYMHYETLYFLMGLILRRLNETMRKLQTGKEVTE